MMGQHRRSALDRGLCMEVSGFVMLELTNAELGFGPDVGKSSTKPIAIGPLAGIDVIE